jgi:hypothetical protein
MYLHLICAFSKGPKQLRHANKTYKTRSQLLSILTAEREPDMSFPVDVDGVAAESVIIPAETADDRREKHTKTLKKEKATLNLAHLMAERSLAKSLSLCEVRLILCAVLSISSHKQQIFIVTVVI